MNLKLNPIYYIFILNIHHFFLRSPCVIKHSSGMVFVQYVSCKLTFTPACLALVVSFDMFSHRFCSSDVTNAAIGRLIEWKVTTGAYGCWRMKVN